MAKKEMPLGGKRAKMGTGRARSAQLRANLAPDYLRRLDTMASAEGITRTALIERWIDAAAGAVSTTEQPPIAPRDDQTPK